MTILRRYSKELTIFVSGLLLRAGYWLYSGTFRGGDWGSYSEACTLWANDPLGIITAHKGILYSGFTFPFCHVLSLPGTTADTWVMIQIVLSAAACVIIYRTGRLLIDETAGFIAGFGLVVLWDTWLWTTVLYSTAMLTFAMVITLWAFAHYHRSGSIYAKFGLFTAFALVSISHPFGPPIVIGWIIYEIWPNFAPYGRRIFNHRIIPLMIGLSSFGLLSYAIERYWFPTRWYRGEVVYDDPTYSIPVEEASSFLDFVIVNHVYALAIPVARSLLFFVPFFPRHSFSHILLNLVTYTPILFVSIYGAYRAWFDRRDLFRYLVTPGIMMVGVTAIYTVSWDLRYRAVLGPSMVLLVGYVFSEHISMGEISDQLKTVIETGRHRYTE